MTPHPFSTYDAWKLASPDAGHEEEDARREQEEEEHEQSIINEAHADPDADQLTVDEEEDNL